MADMIKNSPKQVFEQYKIVTNFKASLGDKGIFEQSKINERFFYGDQWHGVDSGNSRPLVRRNVVKRIGEHKISAIASVPIAVNYSADGVPDNTSLDEEKKQIKKNLFGGGTLTGELKDAEIGTILSVLSDYFAVTAERVKFDLKKEKLLRNAYISGTALAYTFWNSDINTGLYADISRSKLIKGDIDFEILNVENVVFGDPNCEEVQKQPYIIISQRLDCGDVRREAQRNRIGPEEREKITPDGKDNYNVNAGTYGETELSENNRVTVLTKFWKEWNKDGTDYVVMCEKVTEKAYVKKPFDIGIKLYPFAIFRWSDRYGTVYGDSDITFQIPNQIAINRAMSAEIWAITTTGVPLTVVNGDTVQEQITNNPGQIIKVYGTAEDVAGAIRHISPPAFSSQLITAVNDIANNTLTDNGASDAALGNIRPDNAAAIIQTREAALQPMQLYQNKFYSAVEDIARIWAQFWINLYGNRRLKINDSTGSYYVSFNAERYRGLLVNAKIDVGSSPIYSVPASMATLDNMYANQLINKTQYLERLPDGIIKDKTGLLEDAKKELKMQQGIGGNDDIMQIIAAQYPDLYAQFQQMSPEEQQAVIASMSGAGAEEGIPMEVGDL